MNKEILLIIFTIIVSCEKTEASKSKINVEDITVLDSKLPLYIDKINFDNKENTVQLNKEISSEILKTIDDFYNKESGVIESYKNDFTFKDCYFNTIRIEDQTITIFFIILKYFPTQALTSKILFYNNETKRFLSKPIHFKIYALYNFENEKIEPSNLKAILEIRSPEINMIDFDNDGNIEFELNRLIHNGTYNAIETSVLKVENNQIDTIQNSKHIIY